MDRHSLQLLLQLREYDSFLDSLSIIAVMGNDAADVNWWATLTTRDEPPRPYNYRVFATHTNLQSVPSSPRVTKFEKNPFEVIYPRKVDLIMAHDILQYSLAPLLALKQWNSQMNTNGMLIMSVPQHSGVEYNRYQSRSYSGCYYHYTPVNLIYMLAVNGFDCNDAYLLKQANDQWINIAVYKSNVAPMNPETTSWTKLATTGLLHPSMVASINTYGYLRQEDIVMPWLDKENYFIDYISDWTEVPKEAVHTETVNPNNTVESGETTVIQASTILKETKLSKPIKALKPPKKKYE